ncbi:MAG: RDD family protein [Chloroflexia bacterium]|nr:RDD family protein [Chloroflexia bacterium]
MDRVGVGPRALALIIDSLIFVLGACCVLLLISLGSGGEFETTGGPAWGINALFTLLYLAYFIVLEGTSGTTLGKRVLKLKVVKVDGSPIDMRESVIRNVLRFVDGLFSYLVGAILIWTNPNKQRLGDRVANTIVVRNVPAEFDITTPGATAPTERF